MSSRRKMRQHWLKVARKTAQIDAQEAAKTVEKKLEDLRIAQKAYENSMKRRDATSDCNFSSAVILAIEEVKKAIAAQRQAIIRKVNLGLEPTIEDKNCLCLCNDDQICACHIEHIVDFMFNAAEDERGFDLELDSNETRKLYPEDFPEDDTALEKPTLLLIDETKYELWCSLRGKTHTVRVQITFPKLFYDRVEE